MKKLIFLLQLLLIFEAFSQSNNASSGGNGVGAGGSVSFPAVKDL